MEDKTVLHFLKQAAQATSSMENATKQLKSALLILLGYFSEGDLETVIIDKYVMPSSSQLNHGNGSQEIVSMPTPTAYKKSVEEIIDEVKKMIIELKIKGSVREHKNGLLKFTSSSLGCTVYGRTKEELEVKLKEKITEYSKKNTGKQDKSNTKKSALLLSEFYKNEYMPYKISDGIAASTISGYELYLKKIINEQFDKPLTWYKSKDIQAFLYSIPQTRSRQIMQGFLNNIFTKAITAGHIKVNPCSAVEKVRHKQEQGKAFTFDEQLEFFKLLIGNRRLSYSDKCYFILVYLLGTRKNEIIDLCPADVDFKNKVLHIRGTKTKGSNRIVPLTPLVERLLLSLESNGGKYFSVTTNTADGKFREVWPTEKGHKLHDLRHTFGTIQICVEHVDVKTVSLWLGHSTTAMTLGTYTHPEQLDSGTFLRGDLSNEMKIAIYQNKYAEILHLIVDFLK